MYVLFVSLHVLNDLPAKKEGWPEIELVQSQVVVSRQRIVVHAQNIAFQLSIYSTGWSLHYFSRFLPKLVQGVVKSGLHRQCFDVSSSFWETVSLTGRWRLHCWLEWLIAHMSLAVQCFWKVCCDGHSSAAEGMVMAWYREHAPGLQQTTEGFSVFQFASQIKQWEQGSLAMLYSWDVADAEVLRGSAVWNPDSEAARDPERSHAIHTSPHCVVKSLRETGQTQQKST